MFMAKRGFTDHFIKVGKMRFHYLDWGNKGKQVMLLLHGGSQTAHSWDEFSQAMRRDYHVIALDQRGHGDSDWSKSGLYGVRSHMRDIHGFVKALGLRKFVLVGLSMGGRNSIVYSAMHPERVDRLVVVDVGPEIMKKGIESIQRFSRRADVLPTFADFVKRAHEFNPRRPIAQLRDRLRWNLRKLPDGRWTWKYDRRFRGGRSRAGQEDLWPFVRRIKAPTLLVRGAQSDILSPQSAKKTAKAIKNCRLVEVPKAGHTVPGDNPPAFAAAVRAFLKNS
jgi:pimeloyl-ACP methyl ester carboxylesterase